MKKQLLIIQTEPAVPGKPISTELVRELTTSVLKSQGLEVKAFDFHIVEESVTFKVRQRSKAGESNA